MKKYCLLALALCLMSCEDYLSDMQQEKETTAVVVDNNYNTMYAFVKDLADSDLFGIYMPEYPTYDDLMHICAPIVMTDLFGDTFGEGDCKQEYDLMLAYFEEKEPNAEIVSYLHYIIDNKLY